ncbi:rna-binding [Stylonychia lemnae]|uniref:Rna-binding n=1 Tax=Stylonychia lemnae TaxID=5949 RepID=A0A078B081_STYLE|nr:rna-binding [Stylonychia lemnae]|eukprot:CDW87894.1 rna-binding [Stylonychia lemnae]
MQNKIPDNTNPTSNLNQNLNFIPNQQANSQIYMQGVTQNSNAFYQPQQQQLQMINQQYQDMSRLGSASFVPNMSHNQSQYQPGTQYNNYQFQINAPSQNLGIIQSPMGGIMGQDAGFGATSQQIQNQQQWVQPQRIIGGQNNDQGLNYQNLGGSFTPTSLGYHQNQTLSFNAPPGFQTNQQKQPVSNKQSEENVRYFLPDFITDEIDSNGNTNDSQSLFSNPQFHQNPQKTSSSNLLRFNSGNTFGVTNNMHAQLQDFQQQNPNGFSQSQVFNMQNQFVPQNVKICKHCNQVIQPNEQNATIDVPMQQVPQYFHLRCLQMANYQNQVNPIPRPMLSQLVQLTPDMLIFDFQLLHPMTLTTVFQLQNQSPNYFIDRNKHLITFNKLLCSSTSVPFNIAIVNLKWDFLRDPQAIRDQLNPLDPQFQIKLANLPQKPLTNNVIQGQINFIDMLSHNEKNVTITLQAKTQDQFVINMQNQREPTLHLNFHYTLFSDQQYTQQIDAQAQVTPPSVSQSHLIRNLYMSFIISLNDFEILKQETQRLIQINPALIQLLKQPQSPTEEHQKFQITTSSSSLHQIFQGNQGSAQGNLVAQMNELAIGQNNLNAVSPMNSNIDQQDSFLKINNSHHKTNSHNNSFDNSNSSIDNTEEEKGEGSSKQLFKSMTMKEKAPYRIERTKFGIEICSLQENETEENTNGVNRSATTDRLEVMDDESLMNHLNNVGVRQQSSDQDINQRRSSELSNQSAQNILNDLNQSSNQQQNNFLNPKVARRKKDSKDTNKKSTKSSKNSQNSKNSSQELRSSYSKGSSSSRELDSSADLNEESQQLQSELKGQIVEMARQQYGSKQLQKLLAKASPDFVGFAIEESLYHLHQLMADQYGNYFCQKLMQSSSSAQRLRILNVLRPHILEISCDKKGTHSMQCLIEMINMPDEEEELKQGIKTHIVELAFDTNGTHVLQKVLLCLKEENIDFIFSPVLKNLIELSMDQNGLCVIKKIISKVQGHEKKIALGEKLSENVVELVQSPYGNYAVQQALEVIYIFLFINFQKWDLPYCQQIFDKLEPHLMQLSVQKFSSNVIEKILEKAEYDTVERFMKQLCDTEVMKSLIKNNYGFYVMQKLVQVLRRHKASLNKVQNAINETIQYVSDRNLRQKWQQLLNQ